MRSIRTLCLVIALTMYLGCAKQSVTPPNGANQAPPVSPYVEHTIRYSGETLALISNWYTGNSANWKAIKNANPSLKPERLRLGDIVLIPRELVIKTEPLPERALRRTSKVATEKTKSNAESAVDNTSESASSGQSQSEDQTAPATEGENNAGVNVQEGNSDASSNAETASSAGSEATSPAETAAVPVPPPTGESPVLKDVEDAKKLNAPTEQAAPAKTATPDDAERERLLDELLQSQ